MPAVPRPHSHTVTPQAIEPHLSKQGENGSSQGRGRAPSTCGVMPAAAGTSEPHLQHSHLAPAAQQGHGHTQPVGAEAVTLAGRGQVEAPEVGEVTVPVQDGALSMAEPGTGACQGTAARGHQAAAQSGGRGVGLGDSGAPRPPEHYVGGPQKGQSGRANVHSGAMWGGRDCSKDMWEPRDQPQMVWGYPRQWLQPHACFWGHIQQGTEALGGVGCVQGECPPCGPGAGRVGSVWPRALTQQAVQ